MTDMPPPPPGNYPPPPPPGAFPPPGASFPGGYPGQPAKTNTMAIISLVASCAGLFCGIGSIVGIVLGVIARNQIKQSGENGQGLALAGIIVGGISLALNVIFGIMWATSMSAFY